jgi:flagellar motility protein MotE (MotC chaperone)
VNFDDVAQLREHHPAWKLLRATNAPLILTFLGNHFVEQNHGATPASTLVNELDDTLYALNTATPGAFPRDPAAYLDEWADPERAWLRKFYPIDSDEAHYDATPALEKAVRFVEDLQSRSFVGTESRLHTLVELLRQIVHGSESDPEVRIAELERRRAQIDAEIAQIRESGTSLLEDSAVRDRYQLFSSTARELLSDFREVEENFRRLDRSAREKITSWEGGKGELLADLVSSRSDISSSDQGRSFGAFYDFLLSGDRQQELADLVAAVQSMDAIEADRRLRYVHHDWADAAERTQQTVRNLSEQLRRFLEDQTWVEHRRVLDLVRKAEQTALKVRNDPPSEGVGIVLDEPGLPLALAFERPFYDARPEPQVDSDLEEVTHAESDYEALLAQKFVDSARLLENIKAIVPPRTTAELADILHLYPVEQGVAEILGYLALSDDDVRIEMHREDQITIDYEDTEGVARRATLPRVTVRRL